MKASHVFNEVYEPEGDKKRRLSWFGAGAGSYVIVFD
jgi:hypothetical protein